MNKFIKFVITILIVGFTSNSLANGGDCTCDGKLTTLSLKYMGDSATNIQVIQKNGESIFWARVAPGQTFAFTGTDQRGKKLSNTTLGPWIDIYLGNGHNTRIHTSCSIEIEVGDIIEDFLVIAGTSRNNGNICGTADSPR